MEDKANTFHIVCSDCARFGLRVGIERVEPSLHIYVYAYIKIKDYFKSTALSGAFRVGSTVRFTSKGSSGVCLIFFFFLLEINTETHIFKSSAWLLLWFEWIMGKLTDFCSTIMQRQQNWNESKKKPKKQPRMHKSLQHFFIVSLSWLLSFSTS